MDDHGSKHSTTNLVGFLVTLFLALTGVSNAFELGDYDFVDLTHAYNADTIYWPTSPTAFEKETLAEGKTPGGWYYSAYRVGTPEHGGTHLDAPVHFAEGKLAAHELPLEQLIAPAVVIDVSGKAAANRDYRLTVSDVLDFEAKHGDIDSGSIVLLRTGWSRYWPDARAYLGDDTPGDATNLSFPSYGVEAATLLIEDRGVVTLGVDTASIDYGRSSEFEVHRVAGSHNVAGLENLSALDALPATGATIVALPMKIEGGSGGPVRVVALVPK